MLPREKYSKGGVDNLSDIDLIAILVGSGIKGRDFMLLSRDILSKLRNTISSGRDLESGDVLSINGVGSVIAMRIVCGIELGRRLYGLHEKERVLIRNSQEAYNLLRGFSKKKQEHIVGLYINSRFELLEKRVVCIGSLDGVNILPRDIIIPALELNASSVIIAHNHPSGDPTPSFEDINITKRIKEGMDIVGINLLDHIVIGDNDWSRVEIS